MADLEFLSNLATNLVDNRDTDKKVIDSLYEKFCALNKEEIVILIDYMIEDIDKVTPINSLIRLKATLSVIVDKKLLFDAMMSILETIYKPEIKNTALFNHQL